MRISSGIVAVLLCSFVVSAAQQETGTMAPNAKTTTLAMPSNPKAQKAFDEAADYLKVCNPGAAIEVL